VSRIVSRTVEVCVFRRAAEGVQYLLLKRSKVDTLYPGMWQIVTGSMLDGEHAEKTALREFREETDLTPVQFWVVPFVNSFYVANDDTVHASPFFAVEVDAQREPRLSHEHEEYEWCSLQDAVKKLVWPGQRYGLKIVDEYIVGGQEAARLLSRAV
jgi:dihydroneopterin triphosphate diphosphatase